MKLMFKLVLKLPLSMTALLPWMKVLQIHTNATKEGLLVVMVLLVLSQLPTMTMPQINVPPYSMPKVVIENVSKPVMMVQMAIALPLLPLHKKNMVQNTKLLLMLI